MRGRVGRNGENVCFELEWDTLKTMPSNIILVPKDEISRSRTPIRLHDN